MNASSVALLVSLVAARTATGAEIASEATLTLAGAKRAALAMFPDKELAFDLLYRPRLQRLIRERFRLQ